MSVKIEENMNFVAKVENSKWLIFSSLVSSSEVINVVQFVCSDSSAYVRKLA